MDLRKENAIVNWIERTEGNNRTDYFDNNLPESFHKLPKKKTNNEKYTASNRYKYFQKLKDESGGCKICESKKNLVIDHCHLTRKIRGVLCDSCNKGLGSFKDNREVMLNAIRYLKEDYSTSIDYYTLK